MPNEAITTAIRSVLGDYASPEKIAALDAALRPIYGREANAWRARAIDALNKAMDHAGTLPARESVKLVPKEWHELGDAIRTAFGVTDNS